jgi:hypothetical protein
MTALNTATSQEAALLQTAIDGIGGINTALTGATATLSAEGAKLDTVQALIDNLRQSAGVPQSVLDSLAQVQGVVDGVNTSLAGLGASLGTASSSAAAIGTALTAQSSRLDQMAQDPANPVPVPSSGAAIAQPVAG